MSSKKSHTNQKENGDLYKNAHHRVQQKKHLATHFVIFLAGSVILIIVNMLLGLGGKFRPFDMPWFVWAILLWLFFLIIHVINVFLIDTMMGADWEEQQQEKLVNKQLRKIEKIQKKVEREHPLPDNKDSSQSIESDKSQS